MLKALGRIFSKPEVSHLELHVTQTCSECGTKLARSVEQARTDWSCPNLDCPARLRERITHWCSAEAMDIAGGDAVLVAKLVGKGLAYDVAELYRIKLKELAALEGMDEAHAKNFFDAITASMKRDSSRVLFGLGIPLVNAVEAQALAKGFPTVDAVFAAGEARLVKDAGVSEAVAQSVTRWYGDNVNRRLVKRLEKAGVNFKSELYRAAG